MGLLVGAQVVRRAGILAVCIGHVVQDLAGQLNIVVCKLANLCVVDTENFGFLTGTEREARDEVHDEEDDAGSTEGVETTRGRVSKLVAELDPVVVEPASGDLGEAIKMCYIVSSEECGEDVSDKTTDGVFSEDIKSIINA